MAAITPAVRPQNILIIGAGPAGLAAARMAALRGHRPTLVDSRDKAGGLLKIAAKAPGRSELADIIVFFLHELKRLNVSIQQGVQLDAALVHLIAPDVVIVATGSLPKMPIIKGLYNAPNLCTVVELLEGKATVKNKAIIIGGGQTALVLADFLAEAKKSVTVLNRGPHFGREMSANDRYYLRQRLKRPSVALYKKVSIQAFTKTGVQFKHINGEERLSGFDTVAVAEIGESVRDTLTLLKAIKVPTRIIGDAKSARHLMFAISEGEEAVRSIPA
jgi:NADPH-dependent 2,4-dienoyl-CoA reductase/sulfur reductase-like enzyme